MATTRTQQLLFAQKELALEVAWATSQAAQQVHRRAAVGFPETDPNSQAAQEERVGQGDLLQHHQDKVAQVPQDQIPARTSGNTSGEAARSLRRYELKEK